jgi:N-(2-amino-2-carboxyethyl)-L-glutamate synthase
VDSNLFRLGKTKSILIGSDVNSTNYSAGAKVELVTEPDPVTGDFLPARISRVKSLIAAIPNSFWPNQYVNLNNAEAHHQTMHEIVRDLNGELDYMFCTTGTCGTLRGCSEYIKANNLNTKIIAADANCAVILCDRGERYLDTIYSESWIRTNFGQIDW